MHIVPDIRIYAILLLNGTHVGIVTLVAQQTIIVARTATLHTKSVIFTSHNYSLALFNSRRLDDFLLAAYTAVPDSRGLQESFEVIDIKAKKIKGEDAPHLG